MVANWLEMFRMSENQNLCLVYSKTLFVMQKKGLCVSSWHAISSQLQTTSSMPKYCSLSVLFCMGDTYETYHIFPRFINSNSHENQCIFWWCKLSSTVIQSRSTHPWNPYLHCHTFTWMKMKAVDVRWWKLNHLMKQHKSCVLRRSLFFVTKWQTVKQEYMNMSY